MGITNEQKTEIKKILTEFIVSGKANSKKYIPVLLKIESDFFSKHESVFIDEVEALVLRLVPEKNVCWIVGGIEDKKVWTGLAVLNGPANGKEKIIIHDLPYKILVAIKDKETK